MTNAALLHAPVRAPILRRIVDDGVCRPHHLCQPVPPSLIARLHFFVFTFQQEKNVVRSLLLCLDDG